MASDSGAFASVTQIGATGQALYSDVVGLSGQAAAAYATIVNLTASGVTIEGQFNSLSGWAASFLNLGLTGQALYLDIVGLSGVLGSVSGGLQAQIAGGNGTQLKVTGSSTLTTATITGIGGLIVTLSGSTIFVSGGGGSYDLAGTAANTGQALYNIINNASGVTAIAAKRVIFSNGASLASDANLVWDTTGAILNIGQGPVYPWSPLSVSSGGTGYTQIVLRNAVSSSGSSADYVVTTDLGNDNWGYLDMGLNSSIYSQTGISGISIGTGYDGYLYVQGGTGNLIPGRGNLYVGTTSTGTFLFLFAGNNSGNPSAAIDASGVNLPAGFTYRIGNISLLTTIGNTGQALYNDITNLSGVMTGISGGLQSQIAGGGTQLKVTGSSTLTTANFTGIGGLVVTTSGSTVFVSGGAGGGASFYTGYYTGSYINFDFRSNIVLSTSSNNPFIPFSSSFGIPPFVVYSIANASGDGLLFGQISGVLTSGFYLSLSATPPTANYTLNYIATTGSGITLLGGGNAGVGSYDPAGTAAASGQLLYNALVVASGELSVGVSGSANIPNVDFFGAGNIFVTLSGMAGIYISGGTGLALAVNLASTGQQAWLLANAANNAATTGYLTYFNLITTGQNLLSDIVSLSGVMGAISGGLQSQIAGGNGTQIKVTGSNTFTTLSISGTGGLISFVSGSTLFIGPAGGGGTATLPPNVAYVTGNQSLTGDLSLNGRLILNSGGLYAPANFFGLADYTVGSGAMVVIATGNPANVTGILPSAANNSGNFLVLINNTTGPLLVSGLIGTGVNTVLSYFDSMLLYSANGIWNNIAATGNPVLMKAISSLSGFVLGISGYDATTYATLVGVTNSITFTASNLTITGQTLYAEILNTSGQMTASGQALYNDIIAASGVFVSRPKQLGFSTDGAGSVIASGVKGYVISPYTGSITSWTLVGNNNAGSIALDIWKVASGTSLPTTSIIGGNGGNPALSSAAVAYSTSAISNWSNTTVAVNDIIGWVVTGAPSLVTKITFQLTIT
jgi:hypothetical protein